jgi:hypothetical protein
VDRVAKQGALGVQQGKIDAPGVDAQGQRTPRQACFQALLDLVPQAQHIPVQRAAHPDRDVGEAVQLL